jgi:ATP synthase protein I
VGLLWRDVVGTGHGAIIGWVLDFWSGFVRIITDFAAPNGQQKNVETWLSFEMDTIPHPARKPENSPANPWIVDPADADGAAEENFKPLTREEARQWRSSQPALSLRWLLVWQALSAVVLAVLAEWLTSDPVVVKSVLYGAAAVVLPSALMAWGVTSSAMARQVSGEAKASLVNFFVWEGIKLVLVLVLMGLAPVVMDAVNWLALVAGLVVVLKVFGWVLYVQTKRRR